MNLLARLQRLMLLPATVIATFAHTPAYSGQPLAQKSVLDFVMKDIDGREVPLSRYRGKVLLIVNVASRCGYTPQYEGLEALYKRFKDRGFAILAFPANNFLAQEPGSDQEIRQFCQSQYGVSFDIFSKISVKGSDQHQLYRFLTSSQTDPRFAGEIRWNFQKFLVDRQGKIIGRFEPKEEPLSAAIVGAVESALRAP